MNGRGPRGGQKGSRGAGGDRRAGGARGYRRPRKPGTPHLAVIRPQAPGGAAPQAPQAPGARPRLVMLRGRAGPQGGARRPAAPWRRALPVLAALAAVLGIVALSALPLRPAAAPATVPVRRDAVELGFAAQALVVREERVQVATRDGPVERLVPAGRVVRVGTPVVRIGPPNAAEEITAEVPGSVSFAVDGLEEELDPDALAWLGAGGRGAPDPAWLDGLPARRLEPPVGTARAGEPVFKIVDGSRVWLVAAAPAEAVRSLAPGEPLPVELPDLRARAAFTVLTLSAGAGERRLLVLESAAPVPDGLLHVRRTEIRVVLRRWSGLVVPATALTHEGGRLGVWVEDGGAGHFVPVKVVGQGLDQVVVEGGLREGEVVRVSRTSAGSPPGGGRQQ
ncbi:HlyD family efflux transporter periplasmic adaptor subunit [Caldinitratiruptor microaerophilus]|uniref:HlyD family efflux transporter periplasmic adaptor subunit n=1 Tax=Caldinitratiruptor microaerophilus TaxID=671077 RepID=A0AA35CKD9_9FIRM|nr:HlyD family efflux transporter periplasmic adaptor subunit [Caldinitratiruptor microaerophilus]BDG60742.1 hypothetical protein caldi_18320 [Caldinitratiruptor microaerophilus]